MVQAPAGSTILRREPKQKRSRDRIDEILKVAMTLIGRTGVDGMTMKEIAALSGGPMASVYQYFPNKSAIISTLYERHCEEVRDVVANYVKSIKTVEHVSAAAFEIFKQSYRCGRETPALQNLIDAIHADKALQGMVVAETRFQANMFYKGTCHFVPHDAREPYCRTIFLIFYLAASAVRLALKVPAVEAENVFSDFNAIIDGQLRSFIQGAVSVA